MEYYEEIRKSFESEGYKLLTKEYKNSKQKLEYICPKGHKHSMRWNNWQQGQRCPNCNPSTSKPEHELFNFLKPYFSDIVNNDRSLIKPLELDIVIPSKKTAIEFCGLYWHSESKGKDKNYHLDKLNKCNEVGYRLITIFEDEWLNNQDLVKSHLLNILSKSTAIKMNARDCRIKEIDAKSARNFVDKFHLQGYNGSTVKLGAFYNDELVSVMTFSKLSISKGQKNINGIYEISRFCSDTSYLIRGIASKLLKYFINNYNPIKIISYADRRWSDGNLYKRLGFNFVHNTDPNYWYITENGRIHRFNFRKSELSKKLEHFDPNLTEYQNMLNNGYCSSN